MTDLTPAEIDALVAPLVVAGLKRPEKDGKPLAMEAGQWWRYGDEVNRGLYCDDQTAAERWEHAIDRAIEAEAERRGWYVEIYVDRGDFRISLMAFADYEDAKCHFCEQQPNRLVAKARLLGKLLGVEMPNA